MIRSVLNRSGKRSKDFFLESLFFKKLLLCQLTTAINKTSFLRGCCKFSVINVYNAYKIILRGIKLNKYLDVSKEAIPFNSNKELRRGFMRRFVLVITTLLFFIAGQAFAADNLSKAASKIESRDFK